MDDYTGYSQVKVAAAQMRGKRMELNRLIGQLFDRGIIPDSSRNRFLVDLAIFCMKAIISLTKDGDVNLL